MTKAPVVESRPWYREPWPWLLMSGPAVVVVAGIATAWLAVESSDGLVEDDYYKQGLAVNQRIARNEQAATLGLKAEVMFGAQGQVRLMLMTNGGAASPESITLRLMHPTRSGADIQVALKREGGLYVGALATTMSTGRWHASLEDDARSWRMTGDWEPEKQPTLRLQAVPGVSTNQASRR